MNDLANMPLVEIYMSIKIIFSVQQSMEIERTSFTSNELNAECCALL